MCGKSTFLIPPNEILCSHTCMNAFSGGGGDLSPTDTYAGDRKLEERMRVFIYVIFSAYQGVCDTFMFVF